MFSSYRSSLIDNNRCNLITKSFIQIQMLKEDWRDNPILIVVWLWYFEPDYDILWLLLQLLLILILWQWQWTQNSTFHKWKDAENKIKEEGDPVNTEKWPALLTFAQLLTAPAAHSPKLIFTPESPVQFRGSPQHGAPSDPALYEGLCSSRASVTQQTSAGGKLDERLSCLRERRKKTQLVERVTHLHLQQALRNWLALTGCYCVNTHVCSNMLWSHRRVFSGFVFYKPQSSRCEI